MPRRGIGKQQGNRPRLGRSRSGRGGFQMTEKRNRPLDMPGGLGVSVKMPEQDNPDTLGQGDIQKLGIGIRTAKRQGGFL